MSKEKGLYAPRYYSEFQCTADKCRHSCCVDWEICIDEETYGKYGQLNDILKTVKVCDDGPCFELCENGRCPHLNGNGLCNIILNHGEEYLSEICRSHPRFFNCVSTGRIEVGLGIVCEEACRLILEDEKSFSLCKIDDIPDDDVEYVCFEFDPIPDRNRIIAAIEDSENCFDEKLSALKAEFKIHEPYSIGEWVKHFLSLEILDVEWERSLKSMCKTLGACDHLAEYNGYYERLLTYFVYRHVSIAEDFDNLRARLAFAILSVEMIRALFEADTEHRPERLRDWARRYSAEIEYSEDNTDELIFIFE